MKKIIAMLINLTMLISLCGCAPVKTSETKKAATVIFTDSTGRKVEVPSKINKIAVSGPLTQIVLYSLAPEMLVGYSSDWSKDVQQYIPEKYLKLPVLGQLYGGKGELNLEQLLSAAPDVVIDVGESKDTIIEDFNALQKKTGIPFVHIEAVTQTMGEIGRAHV